MLESPPKPKILLIDDELAFHDNMEMLFPEINFISVYTVESAESLEPDYTVKLILLDLNLKNNDSNTMPVGMKLLPTLKEKFIDIPIIVVSNYEKTEYVVEAMKKGANYYLAKGEMKPKIWSNRINNFLKPKILLIDDESAFHDNMKMLFPEMNFIPVYTIKETENLTPDFTIKLILLDLDLQNNDSNTLPVGITLLPTLKKKFIDIPIIVVSNYEKTEYVAMSMHEGADDYLAKGEMKPKIWRTKINTYLNASKSKEKQVKINANQIVKYKQRIKTFIQNNNLGQAIELFQKCAISCKDEKSEERAILHKFRYAQIQDSKIIRSQTKESFRNLEAELVFDLLQSLKKLPIPPQNFGL